MVLAGLNMAQPVTIHGHFPKASGETVYLIGYTDYLSQKEKVWAQEILDKDGHFTLQVNLQHTSPLFLEIAFYRCSFFAPPGSSWYFSSDEFHVIENGNPLLPQSVLPCKIKGPNSDSLWRLIDSQISKFVDTAAYEIYLKRNTALLDSLLHRILNARVEDEFFRTNIPFYLATLYPTAHLPIGISSLQEIKHDYTSWFFYLWLEDYLTKTLTRENPLSAQSHLTRSLVKAVNKDENLDTIKMLIKTQFQIEDPFLSDLLTLTALKIFYKTPIFQNKSVLKLIKQMPAHSSYQAIASMAENLVQRFTAYAPGTKSPDFKVLTTKGDTLDTQKLKGRPFYMVFARQHCSTCLNSLELLRPLYQRYKDRVEIISFFTSHDTLSEARFTGRMNYPWPVSVVGRNYDFLRAFQAYSLPLEIFINENGEIIAWPAYRPGEGLEAILEKMLASPSTPRRSPIQRKE